ncbi:MAG: hypothetical protein IKN85_07725, partial [Oscillospiraceae bacterium]|nr:hypothetical protein [Oscillospiraceae bacterium]
MSTLDGTIHIKNSSGVQTVYPKTGINNVEGLQTALDSKVTGVKVGSTSYSPSSGVVSLPAYPTSLPASDVSSWAKASSKPSYTQDEVGDGTTYKRVSATEKTTWNNKGTYSKPSGGIPKTDLASAVQTSLGKADTALQSFTETDPTVPAWAKASSKPTYTASEVGLGNVGNFKAVSTVASQGLSDTEKSNARANIGAGTSSFSGSYSDLSNKPTIPTKVSQLTNDSGYTTNTGTVTGVKVGSTSYSPSSGVVSLPA